MLTPLRNRWGTHIKACEKHPRHASHRHGPRYHPRYPRLHCVHQFAIHPVQAHLACHHNSERRQPTERVVAGAIVDTVVRVLAGGSTPGLAFVGMLSLAIGDHLQRPSCAHLLDLLHHRSLLPPQVMHRRNERADVGRHVRHRLRRRRHGLLVSLTSRSRRPLQLLT